MAASESIGISPKFHALLNNIDMVASMDSAVLIQRNCSPHIANGSQERGRQRVGPHRRKGQREERTSKMHDTNRDGLDRHPDDPGSKLAVGSPPAISVLVVSTRKCPAVVRRVL